MGGKNNWDGDLHLTSDAIALQVREPQSKTLLGVTKAALEKIKKPTKFIKEALRAITGDPIQYKIRWLVSKKGRKLPRAFTAPDTLNWPAVEIRQDGGPGRYVVGDAERATELGNWLATVPELKEAAAPLTLPVKVVARTFQEALYEVYIFVDPSAATMDEDRRAKEEPPFIELLMEFEYGQGREYPTFSSTTPLRKRLEGMVWQDRQAIMSIVGEPIVNFEGEIIDRRPSLIAFLLESSEEERSDPLSMIEINFGNINDPPRADGGAMRRGNWAILGRLRKSRRSPKSLSLPLIAFWYSQDDDDDQEQALKTQVEAIKTGDREVRVDRWNSTRPQPEGPIATDPADLQRARELKQAYLNFRDALRRIKSEINGAIKYFFEEANETSFLIICEQDEKYDDLYNFAVLFTEDPNEVVHQTARTLIRCLQRTSAASVGAVVKSSRTQLKKLDQQETMGMPRQEALKDYIYTELERKKVRKRPPPVDPEVADMTVVVKMFAEVAALRRKLESLEAEETALSEQDPSGHMHLFQALRTGPLPTSLPDSPAVRLRREILATQAEIAKKEAEIEKKELRKAA